MKQSLVILISILLATILFSPSSILARELSGETDPFDRNPNQRAGCRSNPKANCDKNPKPVPCKYKRNCRDRPPMGHP